MSQMLFLRQLCYRYLAILAFLCTIHRPEGFQWRHNRHRQPPPSTKPSRKDHFFRSHPPLDELQNHGKRRRPLSFFSLPTPSSLQRISRLWAAQPKNTSATQDEEDDDEEMDFANKTTNELLSQAEAWREKAKAIREEALAMEMALQETTSKRRKKNLEAVDAIIADLFSSKLTEFQQKQKQIEDIAAIAKLYESKGKRKKKTGSELDVDAMLAEVVPDPRVVADRLRNGRYNQEQVLAVVDRLYLLQKIPPAVEVDQRDTIENNSTDLRVNITKNLQYSEFLNALTEAAVILDDGIAVPSEEVYAMSPSSSSATGSRTTESPFTKGDGRLAIAIRSRLKELMKIDELNFQREFTYGLQKAISDSNFTSLEGYLRNKFGLNVKAEGKNDTRAKGDGDGVDKSILDNVTIAETPLVPMWVPSVFLPYIISSNASTVGPAEVEIMQKDVLVGSRFYVTSTDSVPGAALFRGNIRSNLGRVIRIKADDDDDKGGFDNTTAVVFAEIQERLETAGLGDKVQLFMMTDPETEPKLKETRPAVAAMEQDTKPVILALSKALSPDESKMKKRPVLKVLKSLSYPVAVLSTLFYSISMYSLNPGFFDAVVNRRDLRALFTCVPVALSIIFVQTIHETAHYWVAKRRKLNIGPPVPIPSFKTLPILGCITPLRSFPQNRAALLDFALSGPLSAITVSLGLVIFGALLTVRASQVQIARFPVVSVAEMKSSFLLGSILSWLAPKTMMLPLAQPVPMHPLFVVGSSGLISNALNLLPIFRLDGGRACFAAVGPRQGAVISVFTLLLLLSMAMSGASSFLITWTLWVALLQRRQEIPPRDDVTEVDGKRLLLWLLSFLLSVSIVVPFPGFRLLNNK